MNEKREFIENTAEELSDKDLEGVTGGVMHIPQGSSAAITGKDNATIIGVVNEGNLTIGG